MKCNYLEAWFRREYQSNAYHTGRMYGYIEVEYLVDTAGNPNKLMEFIK